MIKKLASLVLVFALLAGLMPMLTVPARAAGPDFTQTGQFTLRPASTSGDGFYGAQTLPNGHIAAIVGQPGTYTLKIFDASGTILQTIPLNNLMQTRYDQTQIKITALDSGNILIQYNKASTGAVSTGPAAEGTPNAYFLIVDESGQTILPQTQINSFSASSPQLTRNVSTVELSNGNLAFSWQRNDNVTLVTRIFQTDGSPITNETVLVSDAASNSLAAAGNGIYMVLYDSGAATNSLYFKVFNNYGTFVTQKSLGNGRDTRLSLMALTDGNFLLGTAPLSTQKSSMAIYDGSGDLQKTFTVNGYLGNGGAAVYKNADNPGFVTLSLDADAEKAINDAYNAGAEFTGPRKVYLDYYDNYGTLVSTSAQSVDSGSVILKDYDKDLQEYNTIYSPVFSFFEGYQGSIGLIKIDYQESGAYSITGKTFDSASSTAVTLQSAAADGAAGTTTSTKIDLTFDVSVTGLTASDITLTDGTGAAVKGALTGSGTSWSIALSSVTAEGDISVAVNAPNGYTISGSPKTVAVYKAPSASPETTPTATIDYAAEKLTGLIPGASYTVNSANATADASGNLSIDPAWLGTTLSIVKVGNGSTTTDSSAQSLAIPSRPAAPTGVGKTDETSPNGNNGSITGVTSSMEYKLGSDNSWTAISGTTVTGLAPGSYDVRTQATNAAFASVATSVTIGAFAASPESTPTATIDYAAEKLTGLVPGASYTVNNANATADASGNLSIDSAWLGTTLSIVKVGNGSTTTDSSAQSLAIPSRPVAPTGVGKTDETSPNGNNGSITGVTSSMEYKLGSDNSWTAISGTTVTGLAPGSYDVRTQATNAAFASAATSVTIGAFSASPETTPTATIDYAVEKLTGLVPGASYTVNNANATADASGNLSIDSAWLGTTLSIVKVGNGSTTTDSSAQSLVIPSRPAAPSTIGKTDETAAGANDGTLTGVDSSMEYKQGADGAWTDGTGVTIGNLQPGTYYVRVKATASSFASPETSATIGAFSASPELTPTAAIDYAAEKLTGLTPAAAYKINNQSVTADASGNIAIEEAWLGTTLSIVKVGNGSATTDSNPQSLILPARPAAPTGVGKTDETSAGANDGTLTGVTAAMEYRQGPSGSWLAGDGATISGLAPGTYNVRVRALPNAFASAPATLTIQAANPGTPAGGLTVTATDPSGSANDGKTRLAVTPTPSAGHTLVYIVFANGQISTPNVGDTPIGYTALPSDGLATAPDGSVVGVVELDAQGKIVHFGTATAIAKNEPPASGNNPGTGSNTPTTGGTTAPTTGTPSPSTSGSVIVLVNGKEENAGTSVTTTSGGVTTTAITVDPAKIQERLNAEGRGAIVTIPVALDSNVIVGKLNGQIVKNMENQDATLVLRTNKASYTLPAAQIDVDSLAQTLGSGANLQGIELQVSIGDPSAAMARTVNDSAAARNLTPLTAPLDFTVTATYNGKTAEVSNFDAYVKRSVALPAGIDPSRITTGIVVDPDGTVRHVPTQITLIDGVYYAEIHSLTNSAYSVVWHPLTFADVANHWAEDAVNDMGSRLVINGISDTRFDPNADITRAEFAAIIVRGLGLKLGSGDTGFSDIGSEAWYAGAVKTASAYGLITGFEDGTFRPDAEITREQATNIVAKAMKLTGLQARIGAADAGVLNRFADADQAGAWAKENMALAVKAGLVTGRDGGKLEAKAQVTRAEVAVLIRRLLQNSDLID
ncbi:hypothetical protein CDO73_05440 [Saccharibacillus sp. O23]|uniref:S-layer homology domain-containing protein n=1 Tax=Saccharibacillus sp. O23 TaxID=2009338 RepID=UPI000B4DEFE8|nr:S-layer homology domain-containing protein [Saccharibacillus sp. O23]OWR31920.1 hypothetical protein CDO73_05440 [Saccharibacillus sp. O23]